MAVVALITFMTCVFRTERAVLVLCTHARDFERASVEVGLIKRTNLETEK